MSRIPIYIEIILFTLLILCSAIDISLEHNSWKNTVKEFNNTLHRKECIVEDIFDNYSDYTFKNLKLHYLKKEGITLLKFKNDSLLFWSDNSIEIDTSALQRLKQNRYTQISNGNYLVKRKTIKDTTLYGLILIKNEFRYNNRYLKSEFHQDFNLCQHIKISNDIEKYRNYITNKKGEYLFSIYSTGKNHKYRPHIGLKWGFILLFFLSLIVIYNTILVAPQNKRKYYYIATITGLAILRWIMVSTEFPNTFYSLEIFSKIVFFKYNLNISLGDMLLNSICISFIVYLTINTPLNINKFPKAKLAIVISHIIISLILYLVVFSIIYVITHIINNTNITFNLSKWKDINIFSYLTLLTLLLPLYVFTLAVIKYIRFFKSKFKLKTQLFYLFIGTIIFIIVGYNNTFILYPTVIIVLATFIIGFYAEYIVKNELLYSYFLFILFILSIILMFILRYQTNIKEQLTRHNYAIELFNERDYELEESLIDISNYINSSKLIAYLMTEPYENEAIIEQNIETFASQYLKDKYQLQLTVCGETDSLMIETDSTVNCFEFFGGTLQNKGIKLNKSNFYFLDNFDGLISYITQISYKLNTKIINLFIQIDSRTGDEGTGYPELLASQKVKYSVKLDKYSWAKYKNCTLIASSGNFNYMTSCQGFNNQKKNFFIKDGFSHYTLTRDDGIVIVSIPAESIRDILANIPYIFGIFCIIALIMWTINSFPFKKINYISFKVRIITAFIIMLVAFFFIVGGLSIYYNSVQSKEKHYDRIAQLMKLVTRELEYIEPNVAINMRITDKLCQLSNMTFTDINIYNLKGELISTSRPEIFDKKVISNLMNPQALNRFKTENLSHLIQTENIGSLRYLSAYIPMTDQNNKIVAYINVPYFSENAELTEEIGNLIITGVNINVLMILIAVIVSVIISEKITLPLSLVYNKLREMKFEGMYEKINYEQNDEIGRLVKEYNNMTDKLKESAFNLAKSERESAWREMARQIAHEIKNPLTPMKLNIQHLQRSLKDTPEWEAQFHKTCKILMEQIDNMAAIANAFSDFAQMPKSVFKQINIVELVDNTTELFSKGETTISQKSNKEHIYVWADKEQLTRAFVNLLKNSVQAVAEESSPEINIDIFASKADVTIKIKDNGCGISEEIKDKLFEPNFTTKSSGTGIGLAITKRIIQNAQGSIWFTSSKKEGASFYICLPLYR